MGGSTVFRAVIVEDEKPILELMKVLIGRHSSYAIEGGFVNPLEALAAIPSLKPDVVFLDVEMPKMNGVELAQLLRAELPRLAIIFTTAYKDYAVDAFGVQALDYLLKPVTPAAIDRVTARLQSQGSSAGAGADAAGAEAAEVLPKIASMISCFGGFEIKNAQGQSVKFRTRKTEELLAYFLCHPDKEISKWQLTEMLWPDMDEERSLPNLHTSIYSLKKSLKALELNVDVQKTIEGYRLNMISNLYDVALYMGWDRGREMDRKRQERMQYIEWLASLYKGPLFSGKPYAWAAALSESCDRVYLELIHELVQHDLEHEALEAAEKRLNACLMWHPLNEQLNGVRLELYARRKNWEGLRRHFARFASAYRDEMGLEPPEELSSQVGRYLAGLQRN